MTVPDGAPRDSGKPFLNHARWHRATGALLAELMLDGHVIVARTAPWQPARRPGDDLTRQVRNQIAGEPNSISCCSGCCSGQPARRRRGPPAGTAGYLIPRPAGAVAGPAWVPADPDWAFAPLLRARRPPIPPALTATPPSGRPGHRMRAAIPVTVLPAADAASRSGQSSHPGPAAAGRSVQAAVAGPSWPPDLNHPSQPPRPGAPSMSRTQATGSRPAACRGRWPGPARRARRAVLRPSRGRPLTVAAVIPTAYATPG